MMLVDKIFLCGYRITQAFGVNKKNYARFNLEGHDGIDLVPTDFSFGVHSPVEGKVISDVDDPTGRDYGVSVRVQTPENEVYIFAHLSENCVSLGDEIKIGQLLGIMGNTGNSFGAHLHITKYRVDSEGAILNTTNGFKGRINPLKE